MAGFNRGLLRRLLRLEVSPYLLLTVTAFLWSGNLVTGRGISEAVPPMALALWRWLLPLLLITPIALRYLPQEWPILRRHWRLFLLYGACGTTINSILVFSALQHTTATNAVLMNSLSPIFIILLSWLALRERLNTVQLGGVVLSMLGVLCVVARGELGTLFSFRLNAGDLLFLASLIIWSIYTISLRWRPHKLHLATFLFAQLLAGVVLALPFYAWELAQGLRIRWGWTALVGIGYLGTISALASVVFWNRAVSQVGPHRAGVFVHLVPVFGSALAVGLLGERFQLYHLAGMVLVFGGVYLASRH